MLKHSIQAQTSDVSHVTISPDGTAIASGNFYETKIQLWCAETGQHMCTFEAHDLGVWSVDFIDSTTLVSGSGDRTIKVWVLNDRDAPTLLRTLRGHIGDVLAVRVSPDGTKIASGSYDKVVMIWDVHTGEQLHTLRGRNAGSLCVAWSSDSRLVASGGEFGFFCVWDALVGTLVVQPTQGYGEAVTGIVLGAGARFLVAVSWDTSLKIWDIDSKGQTTLRHTFRGHARTVTSVALSPDERYVVSGSFDNTVRVWEVATAREVMTLEGSRDSESEQLIAGCAVKSVSWSKNDQFIISGGSGRIVHVWEADVRVCACVLCLCMHMCMCTHIYMYIYLIVFFYIIFIIFYTHTCICAYISRTL